MAKEYKTYTIKDFIRETEEGEIDNQRSINMVRELATVAEYHKNHNLLVDLRDTETTLNFSDLLNVALEFVRYKDIFRNKMAFIIPNTPERTTNAEYLMTGMVVAGYRVNYFTDFENAIEWLSSTKEYSDNST
jgi:hypothetical protein